MNIQQDQFQQWEVFIQARNGSPYEHAGSLHAADKKMALQNARDVYTRRSEGRSIWVVPSGAIATTNANDESEFFDPANDKLYRTPNFYKMPKGSTGI
jgi:ring-1,2-phenylacetyl-CoA epoxidase subunit PaaB